MIELSLRDKSIQIANEADVKAEALRRKISEEELKQVREAFNKKFGEYPDRVWESYPFFFASKEGLTFKLYFAINNISNGVDYFYITNPEYPYDLLSGKLTSLIDLGRYLKGPFNSSLTASGASARARSNGDRDVDSFAISSTEQEPEIVFEYKHGEKHKPKRMLRLNDNKEDGRTGSGD